jgi:hypothetical protein
MLLHEPLDVQDENRDRERRVREDGARDRVRRADDFAAVAEPPLELRAEAPEQVDVLRLLGRELEERASWRCRRGAVAGRRPSRTAG